MAQSDSDSELSAPPSDLEARVIPVTGTQDTKRQTKSSPHKSKPPGSTTKRKATESAQSPSKKAKTADSIKGVREASETGKPPQKSPRKATSSRLPKQEGGANEHTKIKTEVTDEVDSGEKGASGNKSTGQQRQRKALKSSAADIKSKGAQKQEQDHDGEAATKVKQKRKIKTKEEKEAEMIPLAPRSVGSKLFVGAHVSGAGGVQNAVMNSVHIGGNAFALFLKSQRKWANPPLAEKDGNMFIQNCTEHKYEASHHIVPHGSYLVNLCHPDPERAKQAYDAFIDDLSRCKRLGIQLYNFHPGNSAGAETREQAIQHLATQLNKAHADPASGVVVTLLETMATRGNTIGGTFEDLRDTIQLVTDKKRVGVCLDTCHVFAAGYDISTAAGLDTVLNEFDRTIGLRYLRALHVNDSKAPLASNRDLHANIGTGFLGLRAFHGLVNEPRLWGLPMVLETPIDVKNTDGKDIQDKNIWAQEIKLMERMVGMDVESEEFIKMEELLKAKGHAERERIADQVRRKEEKLKSPKKTKGKTKKASGHDDSGADST